jgi:hypothetical protein
MDIKNASGFSWSDRDGAGITLEYESTWMSFVKVCNSESYLSWTHLWCFEEAAKPFRNKGYMHFDVIHQMMPHKSKGSWVYRIAPGPIPELATTSESSTSAPTPPPATGTPVPPQPLTTLNLGQLADATHKISFLPSQPGPIHHWNLILAQE